MMKNPGTEWLANVLKATQAVDAWSALDSDRLICRASNDLSLPLLGSVGFQPKSLVGLQLKSLVGLLRLFVVSSRNDQSLVLRIPALTVKGKEKNYGDPWLYRARGVEKTPRLSFGNSVGVHLWIWSPHGEDAPVPNLLAQLTQPCLIPALVLLPGIARTFLNHRSD